MAAGEEGSAKASLVPFLVVSVAAQSSSSMIIMSEGGGRDRSVLLVSLFLAVSLDRDGFKPAATTGPSSVPVAAQSSSSMIIMSEGGGRDRSVLLVVVVIQAYSSHLDPSPYLLIEFCPLFAYQQCRWIGQSGRSTMTGPRAIMHTSGVVVVASGVQMGTLWDA